jgi:hypothetical protein
VTEKKDNTPHRAESFPLRETARLIHIAALRMTSLPPPFVRKYLIKSAPTNRICKQRSVWRPSSNKTVMSGPHALSSQIYSTYICRVTPCRIPWCPCLLRHSSVVTPQFYVWSSGNSPQASIWKHGREGITRHLILRKVFPFAVVSITRRPYRA